MIKKYAYSSIELIPDFRKVLLIFRFYQIINNNCYSIHASLYLRSFAILAWSLSSLRLKKADEVLGILKAEVLADLRNA